jgi:hypothetical protein
MSYIPFGMSVETPLGPPSSIINDKAPAATLVNIVTHVSTPNLLAIGANTVFTTAPDRGRFFPVSIWFNPSVTTSATAPIIRIGYTNSGTVYSDFVSSYTFLTAIVLNEFFEIPLKADAGGAAPTARLSAPPSTAIVCYVATAGVSPCAGQLIIHGFYA